MNVTVLLLMNNSQPLIRCNVKRRNDTLLYIFLWSADLFTVENGIYQTMTAQTDMTAYRVYGGESGMKRSFLSPIKPSTAG